MDLGGRVRLTWLDETETYIFQRAGQLRSLSGAVQYLDLFMDMFLKIDACTATNRNIEAKKPL